ncbi:SGNH/GDSL hydrolase family protein [Paraburkholderia sp. Ac-20340]|uniref:SGNH/GDSL hydrolase family protein n=1 Tax=Paraburkholderia sp. Ac-20340 TaxID=2703888 RepID=UPI00197F755C|nr:SGNH/GDSL hydrolase family protein [Paraburkholderia sp. Ac-20340]MBN3854970.1 SGNH/GDSL hydrolase family protein [Paraburkholderia sp. Ac-20340]
MLASVLAGISILMIGDSHLSEPGYLIDTLQDQLVAVGAHVHTYGVCGSTPGDWVKSVAGTCGGAQRTDKAPLVVDHSAKTQPIDQLIAANKANLVIIVEGDTIGGYGKDDFPKAWAWQQVTALTQSLAANKTACVWVGPVWGTEGGKYQKTFTRVKQLSSFLANNVAPCQYIDSLTFSKPGEWATVDGQHLTTNGYKLWGTDIMKALVKLPNVPKK